MQIGIVADDLTGAADSVAPFSQGSAAAYVTFIAQPLPPALSPYALAIDTETRSLDATMQDTILLCVQTAAQQLHDAGATLVYKKIDSTLRGHLELELYALQHRSKRLALVCPAFPGQGRTVEQGILHLHGVPWTETEFAPCTGIAGPGVRDAFGATDDSKATHLPLTLVRQGAAKLEAHLDRLARAGVSTVFCDAVLEEDLDTLAEVILRQTGRYLPVGSAGLAQSLAKRLSSQDSSVSSPRSLDALPTHTLVVVGSLHAASRSQAAYLAAATGTTPIALKSGKIEPTVTEVCRRFDRGERVVVLVSPDSVSLRPVRFSFSKIVAIVLAHFAEQRRPLPSLILTGGATALQCLEGLGGAMGLRVHGQWQPGIIHTSLYAGSYASANLPIVLKAGGFGDETTLARIVGYT